MCGRVSLLLLTLLLWPPSIHGQEPGAWSAGGSVRATLLVGEASDFFAGDFGAGVHAARRLRHRLAAGPM